MVVEVEAILIEEAVEPEEEAVGSINTPMLADTTGHTEHVAMTADTATIMHQDIKKLQPLQIKWEAACAIIPQHPLKNSRAE